MPTAFGKASSGSEMGTGHARRITLQFPDKYPLYGQGYLFRQPRHGLSGNKWHLFALTQTDHIAGAGCDDRWSRRGAVMAPIGHFGV